MIADHKDHIAKIVKILVESISPKYGLTSIVLYGGFARGEGRIVEGVRGKIPYGDYDFLVITKKSLPENLIQRVLYDKIYKEVMYGTSVDITNETIRSLENINSDLSSYDLLKTGRTIWGKNFLGKIKMDIEDVPLISFWRIINNRFNAILMEYELCQGKIIPAKRDSLKKSIIKLYLDLGSYLTFSYKRYSPFYESRLETLGELRLSLNHAFPGLIEKIEVATEEKLNPGIAQDIVEGEVLEALGHGIPVARKIIGEITGQAFLPLDGEEMADVIYRQFPVRYYQDFIAWALKKKFNPTILKSILPGLSLSANLYENLYFRRYAITSHKFSFGSEWRSPIIINMAIIILLISYLTQGKNIDYLKGAGSYIKKILPFSGRNGGYNFEEIKEANTSLWLGYTRRARKRNISRALSDLFLK